MIDFHRGANPSTGAREALHGSRALAWNPCEPPRSGAMQLLDHELQPTGAEILVDVQPVGELRPPLRQLHRGSVLGRDEIEGDRLEVLARGRWTNAHPEVLVAHDLALDH